MSKRRGAPSLLGEDQAAFVEDATEPRHGKHYAGGRKVVDLAHVGGTTPDVDAEPASVPRESEIERRSLARRKTRQTRHRARTLKSAPPPAPARSSQRR